MSSPFYVWDAEVHAGLPQTIQQAEALAMQRPAEGIQSNKLAVWLNELNEFVNDPANASSVDTKTIDAIRNMMGWLPRSQQSRVEIEDIHVEDSEYFYRELVQSVQRHGLAAYDFNRGLFISKDYMLPQGIQPILEHEFALVTKLDQSISLAIDTMPKSAKQFQNLILTWFEQHDYKGDKFKPYYADYKEGYFKLERQNDMFYEELKVCAYYRGGPYLSNNITHTISIKPLFLAIDSEGIIDGIKLIQNSKLTQHFIIHVLGVKKNFEDMFPYSREVNSLELLQGFFESFKNYLDVMSDHLMSPEKFNDLINHNNEFNIKEKRCDSGHVLYDLSLAKLCNDPLYEKLYAEKIDSNQDLARWERTMRLLSRVKPLDNLE